MKTNNSDDLEKTFQKPIFNSYIASDILITIDCLKAINNNDEKINRVIQFLETEYSKMRPAEETSSNKGINRSIVMLSLYIDTFKYVDSDNNIVDDLKYTLVILNNILKENKEKGSR